jgi:hypothetical protein
VEVGARFLEVGARTTEGVDRTNTNVELTMKLRQSLVGPAGVLHKRLMTANVGVGGFYHVGESVNSCRECFHHSWASGGCPVCDRGDGGDVKLRIKSVGSAGVFLERRTPHDSCRERFGLLQVGEVVDICRDRFHHR